MKRPRLIGLLVGIMVLAFTAVAFAESGIRTIEVFYQDIKIRVNGEPVRIADEPFIVNGRTYVPLRAVAEALGATVGWEGDTQTVVITSAEGSAQIQPAVEPVSTADMLITDKKSYNSGISTVTLGDGVRYENARWFDLYGNSTDKPHYVEFDLAGLYKEFQGLIGFPAETYGSTNNEVKVLVDGKEQARFLVFGDSRPHPFKVNVAGARKIRFLFAPYSGNSGTIYLKGGAYLSPDQAASIPGPDNSPAPDSTPLADLLITDKRVYNSGISAVTMGGVRYQNARWFDLYGTSQDKPHFVAFDVSGQYSQFTAQVGFADGTYGSTSTKVQVLVNGSQVDEFTVYGDSKPRPVNLKVNGAKEIRLIFSPTGGNNGTLYVSGSVSK